MSIQIGDKIPVFSVLDYKGNLVSNETLANKNVVIFFYPKDNSPICTTEACSFRDSYEEFLKYDCEIVGISADSDESHSSFAQKHKLQYTLISDKNDKLRQLFQVPRNLFGLLPGRVTYLVDKKGIIRLIFNSQLYANKHIEQSLNFLKKYLNTI